MKTTMKSMLALMAGAMVLAACSNDDILENINEQQTSALKPMTFTASMEGQGGGTRATIDGSHYATDKLYDVKWVAGDKISVFDGATENNGDQEFTLDTGGGTTTGTFIGVAAEEAGVYYALYPYVASSFESKDVTQADAEAIMEAADVLSFFLETWKMDYEDNPEDTEREISDMISSPENQAIILAYVKGKKVEMKSGPQRNKDNQFENVVLPAEQTVAAGQCIDPKAMLMIAKSTDASTFQFKNVCAYVKVTPQFDCTAIALRSTDATKNLAGTITVDYNEGTPTATVTANGTNEVFLTGTITAGKDYYIAVLPESLASGFTIEFLTADKGYYYARTSSKTLALDRNNVTNLGSFATGGTWNITSPTSGTDANSHSWKLVSANPMLKLATAVAGTCYGNVDFYVEYPWGNDWVLPSVADVQPLLDAKAVSYQEPTCNFSCIGVLKYMGGLSVTPTNFSFWLAETDANNNRYILKLFYDTPAEIRTTNKNTITYSVLYKYVGE